MRMKALCLHKTTLRSVLNDCNCSESKEPDSFHCSYRLFVQDNFLKNQWNTHHKAWLQEYGLDTPVAPATAASSSVSCHAAARSRPVPQLRDDNDSTQDDDTYEHDSSQLSSGGADEHYAPQYSRSTHMHRAGSSRTSSSSGRSSKSRRVATPDTQHLPPAYATTPTRHMPCGSSQLPPALATAFSSSSSSSSSMDVPWAHPVLEQAVYTQDAQRR
jgi:hypothetical protein